MKYVYLVRHGESEANIARIHGGEHHPLTERGLEQAGFIAERCSKLPLQAVFASPMVRAQQTGTVIAKRIGLPLGEAPDFIEVRGPSNLMERPVDDPEVKLGFESLNNNWGPGVRVGDEENFDDLVGRAGKALDFITAQEADHFAVVTHGLFLRIVIARALFGSDVSSRELLALWKGLHTDNTGITILRYQPERPDSMWRLITWNDHAHLG